MLHAVESGKNQLAMRAQYSDESSEYTYIGDKIIMLCYEENGTIYNFEVTKD